MTGHESSPSAHHLEKLLKMRDALGNLSVAKTDLKDEGFIMRALAHRAKVLQGIHDTHGSPSPIAERNDHREVVVAVIKERVRLAEQLFKSRAGYPHSDGRERLLHSDGTISDRPLSDEKNTSTPLAEPA